MRRRAARALLALAVFVVSGAAGSRGQGLDADPAAALGLQLEAIPVLRFNPFLPPSALGETRAAGEVVPGATWAPVLTGALAAGERSVANLDGVILGIGDEANGYRLLQVREGAAVFERDGRRVVLRVDGEEARP